MSLEKVNLIKITTEYDKRSRNLAKRKEKRSF